MKTGDINCKLLIQVSMSSIAVTLYSYESKEQHQGFSQKPFGTFDNYIDAFENKGIRYKILIMDKRNAYTHRQLTDKFYLIIKNRCEVINNFPLSIIPKK